MVKSTLGSRFVECAVLLILGLWALSSFVTEPTVTVVTCAVVLYAMTRVFRGGVVSKLFK